MLSPLPTVLHFFFLPEPGVKSAIIHLCSGSFGSRLEQQGLGAMPSSGSLRVNLFSTVRG